MDMTMLIYLVMAE